MSACEDGDAYSANGRKSQPATVLLLGHPRSGKTHLRHYLERTFGKRDGVPLVVYTGHGSTFLPWKGFLETFSTNPTSTEQHKLAGGVLLQDDNHSLPELLKLHTTGEPKCQLVIWFMDISKNSTSFGPIKELHSLDIPVVIALNKIDELATSEAPTDEKARLLKHETSEDIIAQKIDELTRRLVDARLTTEQENEENGGEGKAVSIIPLSAETGEGVSMLLTTIVRRLEFGLAAKSI